MNQPRTQRPLQAPQPARGGARAWTGQNARWRARWRVLATVLAACAAQTCGPAMVPALPCSAASVVVAGQTVPCEGMLIPEPWVRRMYGCERVALPKCQADAKLAADVAAADLAEWASRTAAADDALRKCEASAVLPMNAPLPAAAGTAPGWRTDPMVWLGLGAVGGAAVVIAIRAALR